MLHNAAGAEDGQAALSTSAIVLLLALALATVLLLVPLPANLLSRWPALGRELQDFGHPLLFAWLAHAGFVYLRQRLPAPSILPWVLVLGAAAAYGAAIEFAQQFVARSTSRLDFFHDLLGAAFALLLHARAESAARLARLGLAALAVMAAGVAVAPVATVLAAYANRTLRAPLLWEADSLLFARLSHWQGGRYPGLVVDEPAPDWRGWRALQVQVSNPGQDVVPFTVRVHDRRHDRSFADRFNGRFSLDPGSARTLRIPLAEIAAAPEGRTMDMSAIRGVMVFATAVPKQKIEVHSIRLEP